MSAVCQGVEKQIFHDIHKVFIYHIVTLYITLVKKIIIYCLPRRCYISALENIGWVFLRRICKRKTNVILRTQTHNNMSPDRLSNLEIFLKSKECISTVPVHPENFRVKTLKTIWIFVVKKITVWVWIWWHNNYITETVKCNYNKLKFDSALIYIYCKNHYHTHS